MTRKHTPCICNINTMMALCYRAAVEAEKNDWPAVVAILRGQLEPLLQQVTDDAHRKYHVSGTGKA